MLNVILPVGNPAALTADDNWLINRIQTTGNTVMVVNHGDAVPANVANFQVVVFSPSMNSNQTAKWDNVNIGVVSAHIGKFLHTDIASQNFASMGDARLTRYFTSHAVSDPLSGVVNAYVSTPTQGHKYLPIASLASGVQVYSSHDSSGVRATGIAIEQGASLLNSSVSPSRRIALPVDEMTLMTAELEDLFDRALLWAANGASAPADTEAPSTPLNVSAVPLGSDVTLTWSASTDNVAVSGYEVHRSQSAGFTPSGATLVTTVTTTTHQDVGLADGTYYYKVIAYDAVPNNSSPSAEAQVTVFTGVQPTSPLSILYVATNISVPTLTAQEQAHLQVLLDMGHAVDLRLHTDPMPDSATLSAYNLIVLSRDVQFNQVVPKYNDSPIGVTSFDARKFPHSGVSTVNFASTGSVRASFWFLSGNGVSNPLASGSETAVYPADPTDTFAYIDSATQLPAAATQWLKRDSASTSILGFGIESGATLADSTTLTGHRVSVIGVSNPDEVTSQPVLDYMNRALAWTAGANSIAQDSEDPSVPTSLSVNVTGRTATLTWAASTDNVGVTGYEVHRGASSSFTPDGSSLVTTVNALTYADTSLPNGTYYYKLVAKDAAGNLSTPTNAATAVVSVVVLAKEWRNNNLYDLVLGGVWDGVTLTPIASVSLPGDTGGGPDPDPDPTPDPWVPGVQPSNSNVGLPGIGNPSLTADGNTYISTSNITYTNRSWAGNVTLAGNNVTLIGCKVTGELIVRGNDYVIEDSDIGALSLSGAKRVRVTRIRTTGVTGKDAIHITSDVGTCEDITIENSYIGNPMLSAGAHYDSIQVRGVQGLTIQGNFLDMGTSFSSQYNATIFLEDAQGGNYDVIMQGNWSRAAGYYHFRPFGYNQQILDNIFYRVPDAGPIIGGAYAYTASGNTWDDGAPLTLP